MSSLISQTNALAEGDAESVSRLVWLLPALLYLSLSLLYLFAIPVGESPDEPGHLQCIEQVALYNRLPLREPNPQGIAWWSRERVTSGYMCYHMPLYYLMMGAWVKGSAGLTQTTVPFEFPASNPAFERSKTVFLHENKPTLLAMPEPVTLLGIRLVSILLGGVVVWGSFYFAKQLLPQQPLVPVLAAILVAGWPQFLFLSRAINNDTLATALAVVVLLLLSRIGRPRRFIWVTVFSVLALLTKVSVGYVIGVAGLLWLVEWWLYSEQRPLYLRVGIVSAAILLLTMALIWLNPTLNTHFFSSTRSFSAVAEQATSLSYWGDVLQLTSSSGWARLGWMNVAAPDWHSMVWWLLLLATAVVGFVHLQQQAKSMSARLLLLLAVFWVLAALLSYLRINVNRFQPQFRFLLTIIPIIAALAAVGSVSWLTGRVKQWCLIIGVTLGLITYNLWLVFSLIRTVYGWSV
jgi:hypothetical protein